ncbi:hypothetical protein GCM10010304_63750 [Streptomyces roseoviolaceus]
MTTGGKSYDYLTHATGNVLGLVDDTGKRTHPYAPTGLPRGTTTEAATQPYRYAGAYADPTGPPRRGAGRPRLRPRQVPPTGLGPRREAAPRRGAGHGSGLGARRWGVERTEHPQVSAEVVVRCTVAAVAGPEVQASAAYWRKARPCVVRHTP